MHYQSKERTNPQIMRKSPLPPPQSIVTQTDAAWNGATKNAGLGWIIKKTGETLHFQSSTRFVSSPLVAEALAMRDAVRNCKELGIQHVVFESDSLQLIKSLNTTVEPPEIYGIVADVRIDCYAFEFFAFRWIPRGKNSEADQLAKQALYLVSGGLTT